VKPSNIGFLDVAPKLMDFGLAQLADGGTLEPPEFSNSTTEWDSVVVTKTITALERSAQTQIVGTPLYLSPEATLGRPPDPRDDLWALALVLYESIAGTNPMQAADVVSTICRIRTKNVPDVRVYRQECPANLAGFLTVALAPDRGQRPATARSFGAGLPKV
jgi:serine/threonine protein kinase